MALAAAVDGLTHASASARRIYLEKKAQIRTCTWANWATGKLAWLLGYSAICAHRVSRLPRRA
eukprot:8065052-Heterocapsa_arctica.AAC.1